MEKAFSTSWKASKRPRKQRNYRNNAPLHLKHKFLGAHLSKELRQKYGKRAMPVVVGDKVKVMIGQFKKRENKIERVDLKNAKIYITGIDAPKKDGSKTMLPINPSNLMITELNLTDKGRKAALERKGAQAAKNPEKKKGAD
jgi:large subunit ribosomal protein L24